MKGVWIWLLVLTTIPMAFTQTDPYLTARIVERVPAGPAGWQAVVDIRLRGQPANLAADSQQLRYVLNVIVESAQGEITQVHMLQRLLDFGRLPSAGGALDSVRVRLPLKPGDAFLSVEVLNFPGYVRTVHRLKLLSPPRGENPLQTSGHRGNFQMAALLPWPKHAHNFRAGGNLSPRFEVNVNPRNTVAVQPEEQTHGASAGCRFR